MDYINTPRETTHQRIAAALEGISRGLNNYQPYYNVETGRYEGIGEWLSSRRDGLVYGVQIPRYDYSPVTTATKTGANAGLVLEASTETSSGRNDYLDKVLFECTRCNGGVDADGMPYVTAIEGLDDRFDSQKANTYAITPVYYRRVTSDSQYDTYDYTDTPKTGFKACFGSHTADGKSRPYILRACYMDTDGKCTSKSGTLPATLRVNNIGHCLTYDFNNSKNREDGLTFLTYGDYAYLQDFAELMFGAKAPKSVARGCVGYNYQYNLALAESNVKRIVLTDAQAANILVGSCISIGDGTVTNKDRNNANMHNIVNSAKVLSKMPLGSGNTAINLDLAQNITTKTEYVASTMPWFNGCCDKVLGTFGSPSAAGLTNGKEPFKFQNIEWSLGVYEVYCDMMSISTVDADQKATQRVFVAPDVAKCTTTDGQTGWVELTHQLSDTTGWKYCKDYTVEKGARIPASWGGTTTTGYMVGVHPFGAAGNHEIIVGGNLLDPAPFGVGCLHANSAPGHAHWNIGARSSTIGHSAPAE